MENRLDSHQLKFAQQVPTLLAWFADHRRPLPWRTKSRRDVYATWVSELMLQQTQVATVIPYFNRWLNRFPTLKDFANATEEEVLAHWAGLGYYSRPKNFHKAARALVESMQKSEGAFSKGPDQGYPNTREEWKNLPGVGAYTASAILAFAQEKAVGVVDANVERVLSRFFCWKPSAPHLWSKKKLAASEIAKQNPKRFTDRLWEIMDGLAKYLADDRRLLPQSIRRQLHISNGNIVSAFNESVMELGALVCRPKSPNCARCPIQTGCEANRRYQQDRFPEKKPRTKIVQLEEEKVAYLFCGPQQKKAMGLPPFSVWVEKIPSGKWRSGLYDLPNALGNWGKKVGEIETRSTVTHHQIFRKIEIRMLTTKEKNRFCYPQGRWLALTDDPLSANALINFASKVVGSRRSPGRKAKGVQRSPSLNVQQVGLTGAARKDLEKILLSLS